MYTQIVTDSKQELEKENIRVQPNDLVSGVNVIAANFNWPVFKVVEAQYKTKKEDVVANIPMPADYQKQAGILTQLLVKMYKVMDQKQREIQITVGKANPVEKTKSKKVTASAVAKLQIPSFKGLKAPKSPTAPTVDANLVEREHYLYNIQEAFDFSPHDSIYEQIKDSRVGLLNNPNAMLVEYGKQAEVLVESIGLRERNEWIGLYQAFWTDFRLLYQTLMNPKTSKDAHTLLTNVLCATQDLREMLLILYGLSFRAWTPFQGIGKRTLRILLKHFTPLAGRPLQPHGYALDTSGFWGLVDFNLLIDTAEASQGGAPKAPKPALVAAQGASKASKGATQGASKASKASQGASQGASKASQGAAIKESLARSRRKRAREQKDYNHPYMELLSRFYDLEPDMLYLFLPYSFRVAYMAAFQTSQQEKGCAQLSAVIATLKQVSYPLVIKPKQAIRIEPESGKFWVGSADLNTLSDPNEIQKWVWSVIPNETEFFNSEVLYRCLANSGNLPVGFPDARKATLRNIIRVLSHEVCLMWEIVAWKNRDIPYFLTTADNPPTNQCKVRDFSTGAKKLLEQVFPRPSDLPTIKQFEETVGPNASTEPGMGSEGLFWSTEIYVRETFLKLVSNPSQPNIHKDHAAHFWYCERLKWVRYPSEVLKAWYPHDSARMYATYMEDRCETLRIFQLYALTQLQLLGNANQAQADINRMVQKFMQSSAMAVIVDESPAAAAAPALSAGDTLAVTLLQTLRKVSTDLPWAAQRDASTQQWEEWIQRIVTLIDRSTLPLDVQTKLEETFKTLSETAVVSVNTGIEQALLTLESRSKNKGYASLHSMADEIMKGVQAAPNDESLFTLWAMCVLYLARLEAWLREMVKTYQIGQSARLTAMYELLKTLLDFQMIQGAILARLYEASPDNVKQFKVRPKSAMKTTGREENKKLINFTEETQVKEFTIDEGNKIRLKKYKK
jgi:hypothetical protein